MSAEPQQHNQTFEEERLSKRPRAAQACDTCRSRKVKCDGNYPCSQCQRTGSKCNFKGNQNAPWLGNASMSYIQSLEKKVQELSSTPASVRLDVYHGSPPVPGYTAQSTERSTSSVPASGYAKINNSISSPQNQVYANQYYSGPSTSRDQNATNKEHYGEEETEDDQDEDAQPEVTAINEHTKRREFHGKSSSMAVLEQLQKKRRLPPVADVIAEDGPSLVSSLHNVAFSPHGPDPPPSTQPNDRYWFRHAYLFLDGYFENLHFIHPLLDKDDFFARAENLWLQRQTNKDVSFRALYFAVLSLGALVRTWSEGSLDGLSRFEWSRKLFDEAERCLVESHFSTDLETVQCMFIMAKICQNELNPHLAYIYLGFAIRTCLSAGFNRHVRGKADEQYSAISKLWWGLYSLEIEMSFALGRPDTLGMDQYHNRRLPPIDDSEIAIIPCMVQLARLVREVALRVYHSRVPLREKLNAAYDLERALEDWSDHLPVVIRPKSIRGYDYAKLSDPKWARRQRLVIGIRVHNIRMLLFKPFVRAAKGLSAEDAALLKQAEQRCVDSATETIKVIYETFQVHTFFHSWWYNTTYIMFAASILLLSLSKAGIDDPNAPGYQYVAMASEILDVMSESMVARKYADILRSSMREAQGVASNPSRAVSRPVTTSLGISPETMLSPPQSEVPSESTFAPEGFMSFTNLDLGSIPMQMYGDFLYSGALGAERLDESDWFLPDPNFGGFG